MLLPQISLDLPLETTIRETINSSSKKQSVSFRDLQLQPGEGSFSFVQVEHFPRDPHSHLLAWGQAQTHAQYSKSSATVERRLSAFRSRSYLYIASVMLKLGMEASWWEKEASTHWLRILSLYCIYQRKFDLGCPWRFISQIIFYFSFIPTPWPLRPTRKSHYSSNRRWVNIVV